MNKAELIEKIAAAVQIPKKQAEDALECFIDTIVSTVKSGGEVALAGFGTFLSKRRAGRMGINPRTKEKIQVPAITVPKFRAGKNFKEALK